MIDRPPPRGQRDDHACPTRLDSLAGLCYRALYMSYGVRTMPEATFTFRVDEELKARFSDAAKAHDRTGAQLLRDFMRNYVARQQDAAEYDAWFRRQVQIGLDSANSGDLISAAEVEAEAEAWRRENRRKIAEAS